METDLMTANVKIRVAELSDIPAITEILSASYQAQWKEHYSEAELAALLPLVTIANPHLVSSARYFVGFNGNKPAGCGGWSTHFPGTPDRMEPGLGHIRHFGVHPDHTRKGVAGALHAACLDQAAVLGLHGMEAWSSLQAVPFYQSLGYEVIEPMDVVIRDNLLPLRSVRMRLSLI